MSNPAIVIKPIGISGVSLLRGVALRAYKDHYLHLWYDGGEWYMHKSFSEEQLLAELNDANARFFMVYVLDEAAGFIKININAPLGDKANALELERIYIVRSATGKGVGGFAMNYVFHLAESLHKQLVWLKVIDSSAAAIAFYKKFGFDICGTANLPFEQMKEKLRGMYVMCKTI